MFTHADSLQDVHPKSIVGVCFGILKKIYTVLTREERGAWKDKTSTFTRKLSGKYPAATLNASPDLTDHALHIVRMKGDLKIRWLDTSWNVFCTRMRALLRSQTGSHADRTDLREKMYMRRTLRRLSEQWCGCSSVVHPTRHCSRKHWLRFKRNLSPRNFNTVQCYRIFS